MVEKTLTLDDVTAQRLAAICLMLREEDKRNRTPLEIVRDSVERLHNTLAQSRPSYATFFQRVIDEDTNANANGNSAGGDDDDDGENYPPPQLFDFPTEFLNLDTGTESVLLKRKFRCPMCDSAFTAPSLKTGNLVARFDNRTQLDVYTGVRQDSEKEYVDFGLFIVMVCPRCLYAAQEREFDVWDASGKEPAWKRRQKNKISRKILAAYHANGPRRLALAKRAAREGMNLFSTRRAEDDAAISLDLAADTLNFMLGKVSPNRKPELLYQIAVLHLMKSLQFEKQLEDPDKTAQHPELKKSRMLAIRDALVAFNNIPDQSVENFEIRESIRYHARRFWAAQELRDANAFGHAGAALQRINNQFTNMGKKLERDLLTEEGKLKKLNDEIRKAANAQKREVFQRQAKEVESNMQLIRSGLENARGVLRVITPIYDAASVHYDKFKEMQRQQKPA